MSMRMFISTLCFVGGVMLSGLGTCMTVLKSWGLTHQGPMLVGIGIAMIVFLIAYRTKTRPFKRIEKDRKQQ